MENLLPAAVVLLSIVLSPTLLVLVAVLLVLTKQVRGVDTGEMIVRFGWRRFNLTVERRISERERSDQQKGHTRKGGPEPKADGRSRKDKRSGKR